MKKFLNILSKVLGVLFLLAMFVGFYMMIASAGKNSTMTLIWMGVFLVGAFGMGLIALNIFIKKKKETKSEEEDK